MGLAQAPPAVVSFGVFEADLRAGEVRRNGIKLHLQDLPFRTLALLLSRPHEVVTHEELRLALWPDDVFVDFDRGIRSAIKRLRDALGDSADNPIFIETIERRGYRWIGPASSVEPPPARASDSDATPIIPAVQNQRTSRFLRSPRWTPAMRWITRAAIVAVLTSAAFLGVHWKAPSFRPGSVHSLVVLPLENLSGDPAQDYLAEGMTDELTTNLARISSLRVVSRTSAQHYRNTTNPLPVIAKELDVDAVVEGSVRKEGDVVFVNIQLIDARNDRHLWADVLRRNLGGASSMQDELTEAIAHQVGVQLTPLEKQYFSGRHAIDPASYQVYLLGRYYWNKRTPDALAKAEGYFRDAVSRDAENAFAYAGLADTYVLDALFAVNLPPDEASQKAREAASHAIALDDSLAEAHCSAAYVRFFKDWDFAGAETEFRRALQLNPNFATAHQWYAEMLTALARHDEAIAQIRQAEALDPFAPVLHHVAGQILQDDRQYSQALEEYRKAETGSDWIWTHVGAALAHRRLGEYDQALEELRAAAKLDSSQLDPSAVDAVDRAYHQAGARGFFAQSIILFRQYPHPAYDRALDYAALGEKEKAFSSLAEAYRNHDLDVLSLQCSPELDALRSDPRYQSLKQRIGLP
jgi:TolB-like protein/DNA-binding winged helix-turn-helix (wHTH) protein/Flp pilus assembly protein TadD